MNGQQSPSVHSIRCFIVYIYIYIYIYRTIEEINLLMSYA